MGKGDERIYMLSDRTGSPNVVVRSLSDGKERILTDNRKGILKSYVYFDGTLNEGLGKASVCLDCEREVIYYIQDDRICKVDLEGRITVLNQVPDCIYPCERGWEIPVRPHDGRPLPGF